MAQPTPTPPATADADWTDQVSDLIVDVVDRVHDKTTGPIVKIAKGAVYGVVAFFAGVMVLILGIILISRLLDRIPGDIWIPYVAIGGILEIAGLIMWSRRGATTS